MNKTLKEFNLNLRTEAPELRTGDVVKVFRKIIEAGKERIQVFEGMIIAMKGGQSSSPTMTVRKVSNGIGVELVLPVFSPIIDKIEVVKRAKVRRSKLYFVRTRSAKSLKMKYSAVNSVKNESAKATTAKEEKVAEQESAEEAK